MEEVRNIITSYVVTSNQGPLGIGNKDQAEDWVKKAKEKGIEAKIEKLVTNTKRLNEIGRNLFYIKLPTDQHPIAFRNKVIQEMNQEAERIGMKIDECDLEVMWKPLSEKYNIDASFEEFKKCTMDQAEYFHG